MSKVFKINEELANIAVISTELYSSSKSILNYTKNDNFNRLFEKIIIEINKAYTVIDNSFSPFYQIDNEQELIDSFDHLYKSFSENYLMEISKPRKFFDNIYEDFLELQQCKEAKSKFPMLKYHFDRFVTLYDKQIDNDAYLAMSIDRVIKLQNVLLKEIAELKSKDTEDALLVLSFSFADFSDYLNITKNNNGKIQELFET